MSQPRADTVATQLAAVDDLHALVAVFCRWMMLVAAQTRVETTPALEHFFLAAAFAWFVSAFFRFSLRASRFSLYSFTSCSSSCSSCFHSTDWSERSTLYSIAPSGSLRWLISPRMVDGQPRGVCHTNKFHYCNNLCRISYQDEPKSRMIAV